MGQLVLTITPGEAALILECSRGTVHAMIDRGELTPVRKRPGALGAYQLDEGEVRALAARRAQEALTKARDAVARATRQGLGGEAA